MDRLRRCETRDKHGHRCKKHLFHLREVPAGVELPAAPEGADHTAFGKAFS